MTPLAKASGSCEAQRASATLANGDATDRGARRLILSGRVQGLGVRPAIHRLATEWQLGGAVRNTQRGVEIELEGARHDVAQFESLLPSALPTGTCLERMHTEPMVPLGRLEFTIVKERADGPLMARVPEDRAVCAECLQEVAAPGDRRYGYPFTSCAQCGPRYTIIRAMPFERDDTSMADFPLCIDCRHEYEQPTDRRFHAQTTTCSACGPGIWSSEAGNPSLTRHGAEALQRAVALLRERKIVALRGLGGFQLLVDATNDQAVERLRARKGRLAKPLAVMVESMQAAERWAHFDGDERRAFLDSAGPIVLVRARAGSGLAAAIHPCLDTVGLLRPTTPLHAMLLRELGRPVVCTSGNRDGEPLEYEVGRAERTLAGVADLWLHHNRDIARPIDDSVVRIIAGRRVSIRLARGLAPLALELPPMPPTIAVGGFLKAAVAWSSGAQAVLGPHIGDQETLPARERFAAHLNDWKQLYRFQPAQLVHDMHPEYFSTQWAQRQSLPTLAVQHHHAHVVAGMLEHGWLDRQVLGVAWDGTGYGTDGTIWGGEFLRCAATSFQRVARLRPFRLPGGEAAIRGPWRTAAALHQQLDSPLDLRQWADWGIEADRITNLLRLLDRPQFSPLTSSAGRLFDAAAMFILGTSQVDFDGQAAMRLEAVADRTASGEYRFPLRQGEVAELDWRPLVVELLGDCRRGLDPGTLAMRFHRSLARGIVGVCCRWPELPVILAGGVFQNRLLTELIAGMMGDAPRSLGLPGVIPPNDGGLAAGQLAIAAAKGKFVPCA